MNLVWIDAFLNSTFGVTTNFAVNAIRHSSARMISSVISNSNTGIKFSDIRSFIINNLTFEPLFIFLCMKSNEEYVMIDSNKNKNQ